MSRKNLFKPISLESLGKVRPNEKECSDSNTKSPTSFLPIVLPKEQVVPSKDEIVFDFTPVPKKIQGSGNIQEPGKDKEILPSNNNTQNLIFTESKSTELNAVSNQKNETDSNINQEEKQQNNSNIIIQHDQLENNQEKVLFVSNETNNKQELEDKKLPLVLSDITGEQEVKLVDPTITEVKVEISEPIKKVVDSTQINPITEAKVEISEPIKEENHLTSIGNDQIDELNQNKEEMILNNQNHSEIIESIQNIETIISNDTQVSDLLIKEDTRKILSSSQKKKQKR